MNIQNTFRLLLIPAFIFFYGCGDKNAPAHEGEEGGHEELAADIVELSGDQMKLAGISFGQTEQKALSGNINATGVVSATPENIASVCAPMGGYVKATQIVQGSYVHKGQVLATLENPEYIDLQERFLDVKNKLVFAEGEYQRHTQLARDKVYSEQNIQQVTAEYKSLKAQRNALAQKLQLVGISPDQLDEDHIRGTVPVTAPIGGYIKSALINIGKFVGPSDVMFEIVNPDHMYLELTLFEKDINRVETDNRVRFFLNNEEEEHVAKVKQAGKALTEDKSFKVYAEIMEPCKNVLPGMFVNAFIEAGSHTVTALPSQAIVHFDDKDYIFLFEREKTEKGKPFTEFKMVEVRKGVSEGGYTEVSLPSDLDLTKARIVVKGAYQLLAAKKNAGEMSC